MGMDLCGSNGESESFNWTGWGYFCDLLEKLGQDISECAGLNDGDLISDETCKTWAGALEDALNQKIIKQTRTENKQYMGGYKYDPIIIADEADLIVEATVKDIINLTKGDVKWLRGVVKFLRTCGGCEQR